MEHAFGSPSPWMMVPFVVLLAAIALGPLFAPSWWGRRYPWVSCGLGAITLAYYVWGLQRPHQIAHVASDYVSFMALIGSLFVVSGGIHFTVRGEATPWENVRFLLFGAVAANFLGTTGASMLLIRPWIRMNRYRITAHHIVFFIFLVSNVGGCLTPIGDPPLFLGYLKGVPFWWVLRQCWPVWFTAVGILVSMFYLVDLANYRRAPKAVRSALAEPQDEWRFEGLPNLVFLAVILGSVFLVQPRFAREALMLGAAVGSYFLTRPSVHAANDFNLHPVKEVAILFAGIFSTMMPALDWLETHAGGLAHPTPTFFYWGAGTLSSVLDNAPTYLSFLSAALGAFGAHAANASANIPAQVPSLLHDPPFVQSLIAISVSSVLFGANTYIGNGPNFMVKAIADQQQVHVPTFLGYIARFTLPYMMPMLLVVWWLFCR